MVLCLNQVFRSDKNKTFKEQGVNFLKTCNKDERLVIHWGMAVASYPFFVSLARKIGRLLRLQDDIISKELVRRSVEQYGDTESIRRATTRLLQSFGAWGILFSVSNNLFYPTQKYRLENPELITWLMASVFFSNDRERLSVDEITSDPIWFPFNISYSAFQVGQSQILNVVHQNTSEKLLCLSK